MTDIGDPPSWGGMITCLLLLGCALALILLVNPKLKRQVMFYGIWGGICFIFWILLWIFDPWIVDLGQLQGLLVYPLILFIIATIIYHTIRCVFKSGKKMQRLLIASCGIMALLLSYLGFVLYAGTVAFYPAGMYHEKSKKQLIFLSAVLKSKTDSWAKGDKSLSLQNLSPLRSEKQSIPQSFEKDGIYEGYQYSIANSENPKGFCINAVPIVEKSHWPSFRAEIYDASVKWSWWDVYCHIQYAYKEGGLAPPNAKYVCKRGILDLFVRDLGPR